MTWIRQAVAETHACRTPMREVVWEIPSASLITATATECFALTDGRLGDLWRCDACQALWRIGDACETCDRYGGHRGSLVQPIVARTDGRDRHD